MANPSASGAHSNGDNDNGDSNSGVQEIENGVDLSAPEISQTALRHIPGLSRDWTLEEQSTLEDLLTQYASDNNIVRYAKISHALKDKTVRDVALRCRWMNKCLSKQRWV